ncbi:CynX/NimT family MFS transporter [Streptomyces calidiresistens]|uniref:MFS transporter n=1 Tax=Streptomyces calidiresistens TaxID=1485586 RepID=A0A7W3T129_9ACTN|nr:MFS transporter [Streptomyces calidiresistens]MBB0228955.1 MFS transporter [Streptomyces calidiresistens]
MPAVGDARTSTRPLPSPRTADRPDAGRGDRPTGASRRRLRRGARWLLALALVLTALNLRPAISGLGPLLEEVRTGLGMGGTVAGLLTSVPALCFALFGGVAPRLARRLGPVTVVAAGTAAITLGLALRPLAPNTAVFLGCTALALAGIAVANVLLPMVVKGWFPDRQGTMTGLYSMALALGTAGAAAVTVPLAQRLGGDWRPGLLVWALPAAIALACWAVTLRRGVPRPSPEALAGSSPDPAGAPVRTPDEPGSTGSRPLRRSPTALALMLFFGLQSTAAYVTMGWMPQIFRDAGVPAVTSGLLLAVIMGMGVPLAFVLPRLAVRLPHQGPLVTLLGLCGLAGYIGLWLAPAQGAWAWAVLLGISGCAFPVALAMIGLRARTPAGVGRLSGFAQSGGYLLAVPGPLIIGALQETTGGWDVPLLLLTALMVLQIAVGVRAGRPGVVEDGA